MPSTPTQVGGRLLQDRGRRHVQQEGEHRLRRYGRRHPVLTATLLARNVIQINNLDVTSPVAFGKQQGDVGCEEVSKNQGLSAVAPGAPIGCFESSGQ